MADNYVQIRIKATDTAKPDLDSLRADLDELGSKVDTAKVEVDDDEAKAKLLAINAELAALNKRVANPKIDTAGAARAEARVEKLKSDLDDLIDKSNSSPRGGYLGKLLFGALGKLPGGGGEGGEGGSALGMLGNLSGLAGGGAAISAALAAVLVEVDGLVSGLAAAGAGVGAFALLAMPAFEKVKGALKDTHAQLMKLDPDERKAVYGIRELEHSWDRMSKAFEPAAFKVFNEGLRVANELLPVLKPFADTAATALGGLLKQVGKFADSSGFKDWLAQFRKLEGPSIKAIGDGIGHVVTAFGKLITVMSAKDVVNSINIAFSILSGTLSALTFIIRRIMLRWDQWQQAFRESRHAIAETGHDIATVFDQIRHDVAAAVDFMTRRVEQDTDHMRTDLVHWAQDVGRDTMIVVRWFEQLPGRILSALASLPGKLYAWGVHIIDELADGIRSAAGGALSGAMNFVSGLISDFIPHSPAKKGALSGRGDPRLSGQRIAQMLAQGLTEGSGAVDAAADRLTGGARFGAGGRGANPGGLVVEIHAPSGAAAMLPPQFWTQLANGIRVRGGDPAMLQRKVAFR